MTTLTAGQMLSVMLAFFFGLLFGVPLGRLVEIRDRESARRKELEAQAEAAPLDPIVPPPLKLTDSAQWDAAKAARHVAAAEARAARFASLRLTIARRKGSE